MEIKPCPFCGDENDGEEMDFVDVTINEQVERRWFVQCICGASGPIAVEVDGRELAMEMAIHLWNKRVDVGADQEDDDDEDP